MLNKISTIGVQCFRSLYRIIRKKPFNTGFGDVMERGWKNTRMEN